MISAFNLPSPSPLLESPPERASTGECSECGEDFGDRAFELTEWPQSGRTLCHLCTAAWVIKRLQQAVHEDNADIMPIVQSIDELGRCRDCGRFTPLCVCR